MLVKKQVFNWAASKTLYKKETIANTAVQQQLFIYNRVGPIVMYHFLTPRYTNCREGVTPLMSRILLSQVTWLFGRAG